MAACWAWMSIPPRSPWQGRGWPPSATGPCLVHANFADLVTTAGQHGFAPANGVLLDLGVSSMQLDTGARGFSFQSEAPLDMRLDPTDAGRPKAADLVNRLPEDELAEPDLSLRRRAGVAAHRPAAGGRAAANADYHDHAAGSAGAGRARRAARAARKGRIDPATQTFQALRIAVNGELDVLPQALEGALDVLRPGGRLAVIAFHSLEDRIVKHFIAQEVKGCNCPPELPVCQCGRTPRLRAVSRGAIQATEADIAANPRARSARLRVAERL